MPYPGSFDILKYLYLLLVWDPEVFALLLR